MTCPHKEYGKIIKINKSHHLTGIWRLNGTKMNSIIFVIWQALTKRMCKFQASAMQWIVAEKNATEIFVRTDRRTHKVYPKLIRRDGITTHTYMDIKEIFFKNTMTQQPLPANLKMPSASAPMLWMTALANPIFVTAARNIIQECLMALLLITAPFKQLHVLFL